MTTAEDGAVVVEIENITIAAGSRGARPFPAEVGHELSGLMVFFSGLSDLLQIGVGKDEVVDDDLVLEEAPSYPQRLKSLLVRIALGYT